jgi:hypothetical protein
MAGLRKCGDGCGTIFEVTPGGGFVTLYAFELTDGNWPIGGLVEATNGNFYGATTAGGNPYDGTVFSLAVGLGPFVKTLPRSGKIGDQIQILGTNLTGATKVSFHGVDAVFTVVSATEIVTKVPAGAASGQIQVTLPGQTLLSGGPFAVR